MCAFNLEFSLEIVFLWKFLHPSVATTLVLVPELSNFVRRTFAASSVV